MVDELSETLRTFIDSYVDSLLAWDVILYLYNEPAKITNVEGLADHFGRSSSEVSQVLARLNKRGLVKNAGSLDRSDFKLSESFAAEVEPFIAALNQRQLRLTILAEVLRREYASTEENPIF